MTSAVFEEFSMVFLRFSMVFSMVFYGFRSGF